MNERIKELVDQVGLYQPLELPSDWDDSYYVVTPAQIEKFVELIVRECASLAYDGPGGILEHFGLKEQFGVEK